MTGRKFRLPVQTNGACPKLETGEFQIIDHRWSERDQTFFYYLKSPMESGDCTIIVQVEDQSEQVLVQVCHLDQLLGIRTNIMGVLAEMLASWTAVAFDQNTSDIARSTHFYP